MAEEEANPPAEGPELEQLEEPVGESDLQHLRRKLENSHQYDKESITCFVPRILRLIDLVDPYMTEGKRVIVIRERLRSFYQDKLATDFICTLDQLNELCLRIESNMKSAKSAEFKEAREVKQAKPKDKDRSEKQSKNENKKSQAPNSDKKTRNKSKIDLDDISCYKCERKGHYANRCKFQKKEDGSACNRRKTVATVEQTPTDTSNERKNENEQKVQVTTIRRAGQHVCSLVVGGGELIENLVNINNKEITAIIDTGASVSVISLAVIKRYGWTPNQQVQNLIGAGGNPLKTIGSILVNVSITINNVSSYVTHELVIVDNLCAEMLFGLDLIKALGVNIFSDFPHLSFSKKGREGGVRLIKETVLKPRSLNFVSVKVMTDAKAIVTRPFHFDSSVLVANSVDNVDKNISTVMLANIDSNAISLRQGQQVASYDIYDDELSDDARTINNVLKLGDTAETVTVGDSLTDDQLRDLADLLKNHVKAFSIGGQLGETKLLEHRVELIPDARPVAEPMRRRPATHVIETERQITEMLKQGIIEPSSSPWAAAYVLVRKKTNDFRLCVDFRPLNAVTKKDSYPLPNIESCLEAIAGNCFFSLLDFASGYWQVPVAQESKEMTAFRTERGHWQFTRMPFGLCNAPASFQRLMNALFAGLHGTHLQVFIDDVCLASKSWPEHLQLLERVLKIVEKANLKLKGSKCRFAMKEINFLGHIISSDGIRQCPNKLDALMKLAPPKDVKEVQRVYGMFNYYRRFVPKFAQIAEPITRLMRKTQNFVWDKEQQTAYDAIKDALYENATLAIMNSTDPILLKTDASKSGVAGILLQQQNLIWKLVSCCSRRLTPAESNYSITDLEGLAIIYSVTKLRHFLLGRKFKVLTDHCALCVLNKKQPQSARLRRWAIILSEFDLEVCFTKGSLHRDVDCLSRCPVDNAPDPYVEQIVSAVMPINKADWLDAYSDDESQNFLTKATLQEDDFSLKNDLIYKSDKLFVPLCKRAIILKESHSALISNHDGVNGTIQRMQQLWWPKLLEAVKAHVAACDVCQRRKPDKQKAAGMMRQHQAFAPMDEVAFDYIGAIPESVRRNRFIIVAVDVFSRFVDLKAVNDQTGEKFARYLSSFCGKFGAPRCIVTDNAKNFVNANVGQILNVYNIEHTFAAGRYSRGNAVAERAIQSVEDKINTILKDETCQLDWEASLPLVSLSINTRTCQSTNYSPYELMFGRQHRVVQPSLETISMDLDAEVMMRNAENIRAEALSTSTDSHISAKSRFDSSRREVTYDLGEKVLVKTTDRRKKLGDRFEGPFEILSRENDIYNLKDLSKPNSTRVRHCSQLRPYVQPVLLITSTPIQKQLNSLQPINMKKAHLLLLLMTANQLTPSYELQRVDSIFWSRTSTFVSLGTETFYQEIHFISPCNILNKFHHAWSQNPALVQGKLTTNVNHIASMKQFNNQVPANNGKNGVDTAIERCEYYFRRDLTSVINKLHQYREKRQLAVAAAVGGYVLSNIVSVVEERVLGHQEDSQRYAIIRQKLENLNNNFDVMRMLDDIQTAKIRELTSWVNNIHDSVTQFSTLAPELSVVTSYLIAKISGKAQQLERLCISISQDRPDLITLGEIARTARFGDLHPPSVKLEQVSALGPVSLLAKLSGEIKDKNTSIYKINSFAIAKRRQNQYYLQEYKGPTYVAKNFTNNCVKGTEVGVQDFVHVTCEIPNYKDTRLQSFRDNSINSTSEVPTQFFDHGRDYFIYCWPKNFTYSIQNNPTVSVGCPEFPFRMNDTINFQSSDELIVHHFRNQSRNLKLVDHDLDVTEFHFPKAIDETAVAWEAYDSLLNHSKELSKENIALKIGDTRMCWFQVFLITIFAIVLLILLTIGFKCYNQFIVPFQTHRIVNNARRDSNSHVYDIALRRLRRENKA